eukprot:CAMPEP_0185017742 /NCGR_PEP_ID=MMETSP1103-20130426/656_1 /TAXON_ID=36769 /ORGANISM="Paraphysomonas bandaiensis, Strain Caron Lab Isolate" /LENGTH=223 /DNA_ID=CAMNT_0027547309 /DNA_START=179 /DNA_END=847 /DNA_ORIENTATION=+
MPQPPPPSPSSNNTHRWPDMFIVNWEFYFVPDDSDEPPYDPLPLTPYNVTTGKTFYYNNPDTGERNMKEQYNEYCIPVFGNPLSSMGHGNHYSCDFVNVGSTNTSYVVLHDDRPPGAPECCIIGRPFHAPPPDFPKLMPVASTSPVGDTLVDWYSVYDKDAGIFSYGFETNSLSTPYAFYMKGVPWVANWMWQRFHDFNEEMPADDTWGVPSSCSTAVACPGW